MVGWGRYVLQGNVEGMISPEPQRRDSGVERHYHHGRAEKNPHLREKKQGFGSWGLREPCINSNHVQISNIWTTEEPGPRVPKPREERERQSPAPSF